MTKEQMNLQKVFIQTVLVCTSIYEKFCQKMMLALRFLVVLKADAKISPQLGRAVGFRQGKTQILRLAEQTGYSRGCFLPVAAAVLAALACVAFPVNVLAGCEQTPSRSPHSSGRPSCSVTAVPGPASCPRPLPALSPAPGLQRHRHPRSVFSLCDSGCSSRKPK